MTSTEQCIDRLLTDSSTNEECIARKLNVILDGALSSVTSHSGSAIHHVSEVDIQPTKLSYNVGLLTSMAEKENGPKMTDTKDVFRGRYFLKNSE